MVATTTAFAENQWSNAKLQMGQAVIEIMGDGRCAAINVDPANAIRQPDHLSTMRKHLPQLSGVFGRVITPGAVRCGDTVSVIIDN